MSLLTLFENNSQVISNTNNQHHHKFNSAAPPESQSAAEKVNAILDRALAKGWLVDQLCNRESRLCFPLGNEHGLICFVGPGREIGEITEHYIEIIHSFGRNQSGTLRFWPNRKKFENFPTDYFSVRYIRKRGC